MKHIRILEKKLLILYILDRLAGWLTVDKHHFCEGQGTGTPTLFQGNCQWAHMWGLRLLPRCLPRMWTQVMSAEAQMHAPAPTVPAYRVGFHQIQVIGYDTISWKIWPVAPHEVLTGGGGGQTLVCQTHLQSISNFFLDFGYFILIIMKKLSFWLVL